MALNADGGPGPLLGAVHGVWLVVDTTCLSASEYLHSWLMMWAHLPGPGVLIVYNDFTDYWSSYFQSKKELLIHKGKY